MVDAINEIILYFSTFSAELRNNIKIENYIVYDRNLGNDQCDLEM